ncbi:hypothetical protein ACS2MD_26755, partial [Bacillus cereus group sp. BceL063]
MLNVSFRSTERQTPDTAAELAALQAQTRRIRQVRYRPSRLDRYTGELLSLYQAGASAAELQ